MSLIKPVFKCQEDHKQKFSHSKCLLTISVGQEVHEGEKFQETLKLVNSAFNSCILLVDDTLQRHTLALCSNKTADDFYDISLHEGQRWLERNRQYYSQLTIVDKIIRWNTWLDHPLYAQTKELIQQEIKLDIQYKEAFDETIHEFLRRVTVRLKESSNEFNIKRAFELCFDYLLEECTAMCLWPELLCNFEVYPSQRNLAMTFTHQRFVLPRYPDLLHPVAIKFKNRKQLKPQKFELSENTEFF